MVILCSAKHPKSDYMELNRELIRRINDDSLVKDTGTLVRSYAANLGFFTEQQFIDLITHKVVLDAGSGYGYLAKECWRRNIPAEIVSLNPRLGKRKYRVLERQSTHEHSRTKEIFCTGDEIQMAQEAHDRFTVAGIAQMLPIRAGVIDVILDNNGALYYAKDQAEIAQIAKEYLRVLETSGKLRTTVIYDRIEPVMGIFTHLGGHITYASQQLRVNTLAFEVVKL